MSRMPDLRILWQKYKSAPKDQRNDVIANFNIILIGILENAGEHKSFAFGSSQVYIPFIRVRR
jgi:hypothetical protein